MIEGLLLSIPTVVPSVVPAIPSPWLPAESAYPTLKVTSPSESLSEYHPNIPESVQFKNPSDEESLDGYKNFVIVRCYFDKIDYLKLKYSGHFRCSFMLNESGIDAEWIAP